VRAWILRDVGEFSNDILELRPARAMADRNPQTLQWLSAKS